MEEYNTMTFAVEKYHWQNTLESAREEMWKDVGNLLSLLTKNDYIAVVYDDDVDIIVVQFAHDEKKEDWGGVTPRWITDDQYEVAKCAEEYNEE